MPPGGTLRAMALAKIVITKEIDYRGGKERFSNGYTLQMSGTGETAIHDVAAALIAMERPFHSNAVRFVYANGGPHGAGQLSTYVEEFATPTTGERSNSGAHPEVVLMFESKRRQRVYARKFFHTLAYSPNDATHPERIGGADQTYLTGAVAQLTNGSLPGDARYAWPDGSLVATAFTVDPFFRTRQFDRRGKRPTRGA